MSTFLGASTVSTAFWIVVKASALLGVAGVAQALIGRRVSAATRHLLWTLAIVSVLLLPAVSLALPAWPVVIHTTPQTAEQAPVVNHIDRSSDDRARSATPMAPSGESAPAAPGADGFRWSTTIVGLYGAGVLAMLIQLMLQHWSVRRFARLATVVEDADWIHLMAECAARMGVHRSIRLLRGREHSVPAAIGSFRPSIVIPAIADMWDNDRRRAVILHETAHVARRDCLTQTLASAACAMYWFHPAAWWAARRLRIERELACDDRVIAAGTKARDYAGHLLEIAYSVGSHPAPALAVSMARPRQLEGRMLAALDDARNRRVPSLRLRVAAVAIATVLLLLLASAVPTVVATARSVEAASVPIGVGVVAADIKQLPRHLKAVEWPTLGEPARRVARAVAAAIGIPQESLPGTWEIRPSDSSGTVNLRLVEVNSSSSSNVPISRFEGLTASQLASANGPIQFRLRRDAGVFTFDGVVRSGVGAGTFSFTADPAFVQGLAKRGYSQPTAVEQYQLARHDIGYAFVDELNTQGYSKPSIADLVRAGQHGVSPSYLHDMGELGYRLGALQALIELRDHGVTAGYVRDLGAQGYKGLSADELRNARDHGVTPDYVQAMREGGYTSLAMAELVTARDHGVTPDYVRGVRQFGYTLPLPELIGARDHGVDVEYVREMAALGYKGLPMASLIRLRDHGVTPKYAQDLKALGYDRLAFDELITLRDHGVTPDRIRAANARAGTHLSIDLLKSLADRGEMR